MVEITLVRHGQAQTGATDEHSYDKLSDLGHQQAQWLGDYFAETGRSFDHVISGTLNRQRDTAGVIAGALSLETRQDARLNELDYFGLSQSLKETHALDIPTDRASFVAHVPQVLSAWQAGDIHDHLEGFDAFQGRIEAMISEAEALGGRVMMVTSGGVIGMTMRLLLQLEVNAYANVLLNIMNTSVHRFVKTGDSLALAMFNGVPHLEAKDRVGARTYI
ncbi:hypothetical protein ACMU_12575 [Actibacterium mucosum KCTC 23349]|uniref:Phosphoglycerate mutase n=1 Tax=Actibacterium mucosum KCTC 23349 TaxID=1454373 RepID=A0A037ZJ00_9RHOB|nr:histidine phosphatase family protein [Actibacterium mucosum]KAJ55522.1 hypothetical protein ACMU_12575 [Actibacterium mucosum KCTC 23349]